MNGRIQHTSGPWRINSGGRILAQWGIGRDLFVGMIVGETPVAAVVHDGSGDMEAQANARLIAAAPELLEALCMMMNWHDNDRHYMEAVDAARAAIAKATQP